MLSKIPGDRTSWKISEINATIYIYTYTGHVVLSLQYVHAQTLRGAKEGRGHLELGDLHGSFFDS